MPWIEIDTLQLDPNKKYCFKVIMQGNTIQGAGCPDPDTPPPPPPNDCSMESITVTHLVTAINNLQVQVTLSYLIEGVSEQEIQNVWITAIDGTGFVNSSSAQGSAVFVFPIQQGGYNLYDYSVETDNCTKSGTFQLDYSTLNSTDNITITFE